MWDLSLTCRRFWKEGLKHWLFYSKYIKIPCSLQTTYRNCREISQYGTVTSTTSIQNIKNLTPISILNVTSLHKQFSECGKGRTKLAAFGTEWPSLKYVSTKRRSLCHLNMYLECNPNTSWYWPICLTHGWSRYSNYSSINKVKLRRAAAPGLVCSTRARNYLREHGLPREGIRVQT